MKSLFYPSEKTQLTRIENIIVKLEQRIAKAFLQENYRKIRNLQRLLIKSYLRQLKAFPEISFEKKIRDFYSKTIYYSTFDFFKKLKIKLRTKNCYQISYKKDSNFYLLQNQSKKKFSNLFLKSFIQENKKKQFYCRLKFNYIYKTLKDFLLDKKKAPLLFISNMIPVFKKLFKDQISVTLNKTTSNLAFCELQNNVLHENLSKNPKKIYRHQIRLILKKSKNKSFSIVLTEIKNLLKYWTTYFKNDAQVLNRIPEIHQYLFRLLWKWLKKRHPHSSRLWIYNKYWKTNSKFF
jgi:hypothetical protein